MMKKIIIISISIAVLSLMYASTRALADDGYNAMQVEAMQREQAYMGDNQYPTMRERQEQQLRDNNNAAQYGVLPNTSVPYFTTQPERIKYEYQWMNK